MADAIVSIGVQKFWDLLSQEYEQFQGVEDQVTELKSDLNLLKSFLKDADAKKHISALVKHCVEEIKEIVYDAEDVIESYLLKEKLGKSRMKNRIRKLACIVQDRRGFASYIGGISKRISRVIRDMQSFGVQQIIADGSTQREMRQTFSEDYESDLVGLEANVKTLVRYLVEEDEIQIVSVTGMGGLGKTTLARQVFNHEKVKNKFGGLAWVCVSQEFTRISVWQTILQNLSSREKEEEILKMKEADLLSELIELLKKSVPKSLIVLDDIWKEEDWDLIKPIFPPGKEWKVLLTSRNDIVTMHEATHVNLKPDFLSEPDSWTLFERIAMPSKDSSEYKVYEKMGEEMVKHCKGLPLAIKALGGLLNTKHTVSDWERLSKNIGTHIAIGRTSANNNSIDCVLSMSLEELPCYLKHCFLYLAHFPEDYAIDVGALSYYWAAEDIPRPMYYDHNATIRQVADGYIEELVKRNMVISKRDGVTSRFETCHLHDVMREVCLFKAGQENFVHIVDTENSKVSCKSRRVALNRLNHPKVKMMNPKLRSLLFIHQPDGVESGLCFTRLKYMRVLDLSRARFKGGKLPSSIGKLIHLRHLSLYMAEVTCLPSSMRNLKQLLYLNLFVAASPIYLPSFLKELQDLTYLHLPSELYDKTKLELGQLVNLETLENFSTKHSNVEDLQRMTRLETLSMLFNGKGCTMKMLSSSLSELKHLEHLSIDGYTKDDEGFVLSCVHLKKLNLNIFMPRLLDGKHFLSHLTYIYLKSCLLEEDPMPYLEKLLELKEVRLDYESFKGRRMVCSEGGFRKLHTLELWNLYDLEEWIVEKGSMPLLHTLFIGYCPRLRKLPDGLRFIYSLKDLRMPKDWKERLSEGGEEYYKVKHIPSVTF